MKNLLIPIVSSQSNELNTLQVLRIFDIKNGKLCKTNGNFTCKKHIMGVFCSEINQNFDFKSISLDIEYEFYKKDFSAIYLDFDDVKFVPFVAFLENFCKNKKIKLFVPLNYENSVNHAHLVFKTSISGGDLEQILELKKMQLGSRLVCEIVDCKREFLVPSKSNDGKLIKDVQLEGKNVYFSENLCTNYFTFMNDDETCVFTIFDDENSLNRKIEKCQNIGIDTLFISFETALKCNINF